MLSQGCSYALSRQFAWKQALRSPTPSPGSRRRAAATGDVVDENLRHAFPNLDQKQRRRLTRQMWRHLVLLILEVAHVPRKIHGTNWRKFVRLRNVKPLMQTLLEDRPVVVVTGHFGNFEVGGYMLGLLGFPTHSVARTLDNVYVNDFLERFRGATGQHIIPKNGGYDQILEVLGARGTMAFLADQAAGPKGCFVDFFGRPASTYKAIALLALEHDAPIAVCYARRLDRPMHFEMVVSDMIDPRDTDGQVATVKDLTQWYTTSSKRPSARIPSSTGGSTAAGRTPGRRKKRRSRLPRRQRLEERR
jgi:KDO2-lipid IV(A) lauroyltransferase